MISQPGMYKSMGNIQVNNFCKSGIVSWSKNDFVSGTRIGRGRQEQCNTLEVYDKGDIESHAPEALPIICSDVEIFPPPKVDFDFQELEAAVEISKCVP